MNLTDLLTLGACALLNNGNVVKSYISDEEIEKAVAVVRRVWLAASGQNPEDVARFNDSK